MAGYMLRLTPRSAKHSERRNQFVFRRMSFFFEEINKITKLLPTKPKIVKSQASTVYQRGSCILVSFNPEIISAEMFVKFSAIYGRKTVQKY